MHSRGSMRHLMAALTAVVMLSTHPHARAARRRLHSARNMCVAHIHTGVCGCTHTSRRASFVTPSFIPARGPSAHQHFWRSYASTVPRPTSTRRQQDALTNATVNEATAAINKALTGGAYTSPVTTTTTSPATTGTRSSSSSSWSRFSSSPPPRQPPPPSSSSSSTATGVHGVGAAGVDAYDHRNAKVSAEGLPLVYEPAVIKRYWDARPAEMTRRWTLFVSTTTPFIAGLVRDFTRGNIVQNEVELARNLRIVLEKLGPTFVKLGQALSIRPDVVGPAATEELAKLQDAVPPFSNDIAYALIDQELGRPWQEVFSEISPSPIAAASLAQVYKAKLKDSGDYVAVKVQRPEMLETVSKDLYVMRRAVEVYQKYIVERFTAQTTNYQELLQVWATGFYEELDFLNEAANQEKMREALQGEGGIFIPRIYREYSTRRLLVSEWVDGIKLTQASKAEIRRLTKVAQECFLRQLLELGFLHADPHPGNLMVLKDTSKGQLAILDFGLMAKLQPQDMEMMVNALVHTANKDFGRLIDDLIDLKVLPRDVDRAKIEPVMRRVIGPYVFQGGGAKNFNYQSLAKDLTQATVEIPFNIPSYFALVARALGVLEGIALTGDPDYRMVMEAYPYVSRRLMTDSSPRLQRALNDILYGGPDGKGETISFRRLWSLVSYAMDAKSSNTTGVETVFVDFDQTPSTAVRLNDTLSFLLSDNAAPIRSVLVPEFTQASDLFIRQQLRRTSRMLPRPPFVPYPEKLVDTLAPPLTLEEEILLKSLMDLAYALLGVDANARTSANALLSPQEMLAFLRQVDVEEARELLRMLEPGTTQARTLTAFSSDIFKGLAQRARVRVRRAIGVGEDRTGRKDGSSGSGRVGPGL